MALPTFTETRGPQIIDPATKSGFTIPVVYCTVGSCDEPRKKGYTGMNVNTAELCRVAQQFSISLNYSGLADVATADIIDAINYMRDQFMITLAATNCAPDPEGPE